jgi:hypothetical protein
MCADYITAFAACVAAFAAVVSAAAFIYSLVYVRSQLKEMRIATEATAFSKALEILQDNACREARRVVFGSLASKPFGSWSILEKYYGERVCQSYDQVGKMVYARMFREDLVVDNWEYSLRRSWEILEPLVNEYRLRRGSEKLWDDFEELAKEAIRRNSDREALKTRQA